jgi:hypothetical protein
MKGVSTSDQKGRTKENMYTSERRMQLRVQKEVVETIYIVL